MRRDCRRNGDIVEIRVPCRPEYVRTVRRTLAEFAESLRMSRTAVEELEVAISEAVSNVIRHAYTDCDDHRPVRVKFAHCNNVLVIEVMDRGCGFQAPPDDVVPDVNLDREGGLGIILIKSLMDSVSYTSKPQSGTTIRMTKTDREAVPVPVRISQYEGS